MEHNGATRGEGGVNTIKQPSFFYFENWSKQENYISIRIFFLINIHNIQLNLEK